MSELGTYPLGMLLRGCLLALLLITVERLFQVRPGRKQLLVLLCLSFLPLSQPVLRLPPEIQLRTMQTVREERPAAAGGQMISRPLRSGNAGNGLCGSFR